MESYNYTTHKEITLYTEEGIEFDIELEINYVPGEEPTYWEPGTPDFIEIADIYSSDYPVDISYNEMWGLIWEYERENFSELMELITG